MKWHTLAKWSGAAALALVTAATVHADDDEPAVSCSIGENRCVVRRMNANAAAELSAAKKTAPSIEARLSAKRFPSDLTALGRITWIEDLQIRLESSNLDAPVDLGPLATLQQLRVLWIGIDIEPASYTPLLKLTRLVDLSINAARLRDLSPIAGATGLRSLRLFKLAATNLTPIGGLESLESLSLPGRVATDLSPLAQLARLRHLELSDAVETDLAAFAALDHLEHVDISDAGVADLKPASGWPRLTTLNVAENPKLRDVSPLANASALEDLTLRDTAVADLQPLAHATSLRSLDISMTPVTSLTPLAALRGLANLNASHTGVTDVRALAKVTELGKLELEDTPVRDIRPLANLTNLHWLSLGCSKVRDPTPLRKLTQLHHLYLPENTPPKAVAMLVRALPTTTVHVTPDAWCHRPPKPDR